MNRSQQSSTTATSIEAPATATILEFGSFAFDRETLELRFEGRVRALEPLPARILGYLVERAGRLVPRDELRRFGWPRLPGVADDSLNTCIAQIRDALDDDARRPRWIETLRGRGYRFRGTVVRRTPDLIPPGSASAGPWVSGGATAASAPPRRRSPWRMAATGVLAVAATGVLGVAAPLVVGGTLAPGEARLGREPLDPDAAVGVAAVEYRMTRALDLVGALVLADSLVERHPGVPEVHAVRATALMFAGRRAEARSEAGRALARHPDQPEALRVVGNLHMFDAAWPEARTALERSIEGAPEASETWVSLAFLHTVLGDFDVAATPLERAVGLDPMSALILGDAGLLHLWAGRYDAALEACATAVRVEPRAVWAVSCAFDAARLAGRSQEAVAWGRRLPGLAALPAEVGVDDLLAARARRLEVAEADGRGDPYTLATTYAALGRIEEAERALGLAARSPGFGLLAAAVDPRMAPLRGRVGYESVVVGLGLGGVERAGTDA